MAEKIDWTKYVIPRTISNEKYGATTDYVTIPSVEEYLDKNNLFSAKELTHFAIACGSKYSLVKTREGIIDVFGNYWLRNGKFVTGRDDDICHDAPYLGQIKGLAPSISLKLPDGYTVEQLTQQLGLTKQKHRSGKTYYQVSLGEYPRERVDNQLEYKLDKQFDQVTAHNHLHCTGRLYTSIVDSYVGYNHEFCKRHYPEFEYLGEKYVLVVDQKENRQRWYKVQPITWWVKNIKEVLSGKAKQIDLDCTEVIIGGIPFHPDQSSNDYAKMWQNSLVRAFLNSADARQLDGDPDYQIAESDWDFTKDGFLQQALNMTREPTREYTIQANESVIGNDAFVACRGIEKVFVPNYAYFGYRPFQQCSDKLQFWVGANQEYSKLYDAIPYNPQYLYVPKTADGKWLVLSFHPDDSLQNDYWCIDACHYRTTAQFFERNYRENFIQLTNWKINHKIKFIPPAFTMKVFPSTEMANYFINNNQKRWAELVKHLRFEFLNGDQKTNSLTDLMKIYYALGGFSQHQGERDKAFDYVMQHVATYGEPQTKQSLDFLLDALANLYSDVDIETEITKAGWIGDEIHKRFSRLELKGPYNPTFAKFFMKYYHQNPDFMKFRLYEDEQDFLCIAHNCFNQILKNYPNRVVNGNTERNLLSPRFVAEHCTLVEYENVDADNLPLAEIVGHYSYSQKQFNDIQTIYNQAKALKDDYVIRADRTVEENGVTFRVLAKDDPLGFVIGDITNCCQHIGGAGDSCVRDGYTNPHAGFLVFEEALRDENGAPTGQKRILGQAYVWYDPKTQTVCYDNIEIPDKVMSELERGEKHSQKLSMNTLMKTVVNSADAIMTTMNQNGTKVKRVTVGMAYNDLNGELSKKFQLIPDVALHRGYKGYTDAKKQYLIRTYDETTKRLAAEIMDTAEQIKQVNQNAQTDTECER